MSLQIHHGDCLELLPTLADNSIDAILTDPPYHLNFMNSKWDGGDIAFRPDVWIQCLRVLKPGGYMCAFASTRGYHRMVCAIEDAGFVIHPMLAWVTAQGFPKAASASKAIDKFLGHDREVVGIKPGHEEFIGRAPTGHGWSRPWNSDPASIDRYHQQTAPATPEAAQWEGWAYGLQSLKPAMEPICLAQKPMIGTGAENLLAWGVGALNIDATRITPTFQDDGNSNRVDNTSCTLNEHEVCPICRTPCKNNQPLSDEQFAQREALVSNVQSDDRSCQQLEDYQDRYHPYRHSYDAHARHHATSDQSSVPLQDDVHMSQRHCAKCGYIHADLSKSLNDYTTLDVEKQRQGRWPANLIHTGLEESWSRYFYCVKASKADRAGSKHTTVKPIKLLKYLLTLITPPGGTVLDPFAGSGTTGAAAMELGYDAILIEKEDEYYNDIERRFLIDDPVVSFGD